MICAVKEIDSHQYEVKDGRIGYRNLDTISFDVSYGYFTNFAYFKEHEAENITDQQLQAIIGINLTCGTYSYHEA